MEEFRNDCKDCQQRFYCDFSHLGVKFCRDWEK